jgi:hypothetical protein
VKNEILYNVLTQQCYNHWHNHKKVLKMTEPTNSKHLLAVRLPEKSSFSSPARITLAIATLIAVGTTLAAFSCIQFDLEIVIEGYQVTSDSFITYSAIVAGSLGAISFATFFIHRPLSPAKKLIEAALLTYFAKISVAQMRREDPAKIIEAMNYCVTITSNLSGSLVQQTGEEISNFFNTFIIAIKNKNISANKVPPQNRFYRKMVAKGYNPSDLFAGKWLLQGIISPHTQVVLSPGDLKEQAKEKLTRNYWRGVLAGDLNGNRYKPAGEGVNGALFFVSLESEKKGEEFLLEDEKEYDNQGNVCNQPPKYMGVFKPHPHTVREQQSFFNIPQLQERCKSVLGMAAFLNKADPHRRVHNELFAYELFHIFGFAQKAKELNLDLQFPTTLLFENENDNYPLGNRRPASFCAFLPGFSAVKDHVEAVNPNAEKNCLDEDRDYTDNELTIWQLSKIFDFLTGNLDGHEGNAFVKILNGFVEGTGNFDYDKAFIARNPKNPPDNQYKWAKLKISEQPLTERTKQALRDLLGDGNGDDNDAQIKQLIGNFRSSISQHRGLIFVDEQETLLRQRIGVLQRAAQGDERIEKLSDLRNFRTDADFK